MWNLYLTMLSHMKPFTFFLMDLVLSLLQWVLWLGGLYVVLSTLLMLLKQERTRHMTSLAGVRGLSSQPGLLQSVPDGAPSQKVQAKGNGKTTTEDLGDVTL